MPNAAIRFPDDIANRLTDDSEWQLNVLDEHGKPVFQTLEPPTERVARLDLAEGLADVDRDVKH